MQVIYRATHLPTNKPYIGYKKDIDTLSGYKTSSKVVKAMMIKTPDEWAMEPIVVILPGVDIVEALRLEQEVIKQYFEELGGWDGIWNKCIGYGQEYKYSPEALEKSIQAGATQEAREAASQKATQHYVNHPEAIDAYKLTMQKYWTDPAFKEAMSLTRKKIHANNPELGKAHGLKVKEHCAKPGVREAMSKAKKDWGINNPEDLKASRQKILEAQGKKIEVTFLDGEIMSHFGAKELEEKLGAWNLRKMAKGKSHHRKDGSLCPITCKAPQYAGRKIVGARYV